ncbi:ECs1072 family phage-associated protein [Symbiopectobacterium sp. RP]|uniref:ECs1072 family phage-associated protein n=1 Tax=Symbiopectobacterium sp. RP TaxID=3248553 RepID=UPI003D29E75B
MTDYDNLYLTLKHDLIKFYDTNEYDIREKPSTLKVLKCHTHLHHLLLIEMVFKNHRDKYKKSISDLSGIKALHHMVFLKTNWRPEEIRSTSVHDLLFVLQEEMNSEYLPEEERKYLKTILNYDNPPKIDLASYAGWSIGEGDQYVRSDQ